MNQVIVQFRIGDSTDFDWLLHVEETLTRALALDHLADVHRHAFEEDRFNVFVLVSGAWKPVLDRITEVLERLDALPSAVVAKFHADTERYEVVRPDSYPGDFAL